MSDRFNYKARIYDNYYRTHILPRKGAVTIDKLRRSIKVFDLHFGEFLPQDRTAQIVDAGCGSGNLVYWMQQRGYANAGGFDGSPDQIAAGQELGIANLEIGNIESMLARRPSAFDLIFMRDVLEHIEKEHVLGTLDLCLTALKPGGSLVMQMPNGASPVLGRVLYGDFTHEFAYTQTSLDQLFRLTGFTNIQFRPFEPYVPALSWKSPLSRRGLSAIGRRLAWWTVKSLYHFMIFAEVGPHKTIMTFNLIAAATRPR